MTNKSAIDVFSISGGSQGSFGSVGTVLAVFQPTSGLALDATATNLYLADQRHNQIDVYSSSGVFESNIGPASGPGQLFAPSSVSISGTGLVYATDTKPDLKIFATDGTYISTVATTVNGNALTRRPCRSVRQE